MLRKRLVRFAAVFALFVAFMAAMPIAGAQADTGQPAAHPAMLLQSTTDNPYLIADIAEEASPSIVFIDVKWPEATSGPRTDPFWDIFDNWFFSPMPRTPRSSAGTGFFIDEAGIILTNQHVVGNVGDGQEITVTVNAGEISGDYKATLIGADVTLDLAVLQIDNDDTGPFPVIPLGDSDISRPGEWVVAIGNPYGKQFEHTVTVGVLSAKGREITVQTSDGTRVYKNLMQTDAAINRGNSGGPLLNIAGEVIGINTAVHAQAQGIGFAIPVNVAKDVLDELIETGGVEHHLPPRAWLGVWYLDVTPDIAERIGLPDTKGIIITDIIQGSPAQEAGLRSMDVVRRLDDVDIHAIEDFAGAIANREPGDEILLNILRDGQPMFITATLGNVPPQHR